MSFPALNGDGLNWDADPFAVTQVVAIPLSVTTLPETDLTSTTVTLNGELTELDTSADVYFEYRETGAAEWVSTTAQTLTAVGTFSEGLTGLTHTTEYEYRAVATEDGDTVTGDPVSFTTDGATYVVDIQINGPGMDMVVFEDVEPGFEVTDADGLQPGETYQWWIRLDGGEWEDQGTFTMQEEIPIGPTLTREGTDLPLVINWTPSGSLEGEIEISQNGSVLQVVAVEAGEEQVTIDPVPALGDLDIRGRYRRLAEEPEVSDIVWNEYI